MAFGRKAICVFITIAMAATLLVSLLLAAVPVAANVSQAMVYVYPDDVSAVAEYTITFSITEALYPGDDIRLVFPTDTDLGGITDAADADCTVAATSGIGTSAFVATNSTSEVQPDDDQRIDIDVPFAIGALAGVQVVLRGVINASQIGSYVIEVATDDETTWVESESYTIKTPVVGGPVYVYNASDIYRWIFLVAQRL